LSNEIKVKIFHKSTLLAVFQGDDKYFIEKVEDFEKQRMVYTITRMSPLGNKIINPSSDKFKELVKHIEKEVYGKDVKFADEEDNSQV